MTAFISSYFLLLLLLLAIRSKFIVSRNDAAIFDHVIMNAIYEKEHD